MQDAITPVQLQNTNELLDPQLALEFGSKSARLLKDIVVKNKWTTKIQGKDYLQFEAWQTLAKFYGMTVKTVDTKYVEYGSAKGFEATSVVLDRNGNEVGGAEALCLDDEMNWRGKPLYAIKSMAQTRAGAKALRQMLSWVVVLAGYAPTPKEEMDGVLVNPPQPQKFTQGDIPSPREALVTLLLRLRQDGKVVLTKPTNDMTMEELVAVRDNYMKKIGK